MIKKKVRRQITEIRKERGGITIKFTEIRIKENSMHSHTPTNQIT